MKNFVVISLIFLMSLFLFCNITSAYTISDVAINPTGTLSSGTWATLNFTVSYDFSQGDKPLSGDKLAVWSDLDYPTFYYIQNFEQVIYGGGTRTITLPFRSHAPEGYHPKGMIIDLTMMKNIAGPVGQGGSSYLKNIWISTTGSVPFSCPSTGNITIKVDHMDVRENIIKESIIPITICQQVTPVPTTSPIVQSPYITGPTTINAPGYYILQNDFLHEGPTFGIRITAPNVIFDGNSHIITGSGLIEQSIGIWIDGSNGGTAKNVTVKNVQIKNSYFGISATKSPSEETNHNIIDNIVTDCVTGIAIIGGNKTTLMHNTASNNTHAGIFIMENSHGNILVNNIARNNGFKNFYLSSTDNILSGNIESQDVVTFTPTPTESAPIVTTAVPTITQITTMTTPFITLPTTVQTTTVTTAPTDSVNKLLEEQNKKIEEQNKKLADLNKTIAEQNQKLSEQNDILTQIINFLKSMFGWK